MSTKNFIISAYYPLWDKSSKDLFITDPYVYHVLEKEGKLNRFDNIEVAPPTRKTRTDIDNDSLYVDVKYNKYIDILSKRLNEIHGTTHNESFWKKALSMAFIRYLTSIHDLYKKCELYFNSDLHTCTILAEDSYFIPLDFEDHRYCFEDSDYGMEQIFSLYIRLFYPGVFTEMHQQTVRFDRKIAHSGLKFIEADTIRNMHNIYDLGRMVVSEFLTSFKRDANTGRKIQNSYYLVKRVMRKFLSLIRTEMVSKKDIQVGIIGSFFSEENLSKLIKGSQEKIYPLDWTIQLDYEDKDVLWDKRKHLAQFNADFDRFDEFFFSTIPYCLPKVFVEHFKEIEIAHSSCLKRYQSLRYIVSEAWISETFMSIFLAIAQEKGVKHVNNEHNCFFHPCAGSFISHVIDMSDVYVTLGWFDPRLKGLVKGASLFPFSIENDFNKVYKILYVSVAASVNMSHYSSAYSSSEENAIKHFGFCKSFFKNLGKDTLEELTYRAYPLKGLPFLCYDKEHILSSYLNQIKSFADVSEPSKIQMLKSHLVVIDYIATSYIEALVMNIPTVFFWNADAYYLNDEYSDFFKPLVDAKICQTDPVEAARFVESIKDNPQKWWMQETVQKAKDDFLQKNIGKPEVMIDYLLSLVTQPTS
ncbi:MAG: LIC12162 family protein [Ignavibacteriales bacterium]|nr:LIC12162 family protein [Ignavibacteriales bacterium]